MKKASDDLFRLIKAMSKSEKGYYKKFARKSSSNTNNNLIILFDAIDDLDSYDEEKLKCRLKNTLSDQLPVYKNYLYKNIMKALHLYSSDSSIAGQLREMIGDVDILNKKGLFDQSRKILNKIKKTARSCELDLLSLEALHLEKNLDMITTAGRKRYDSAIRNYKEELDTLDKIRNVSHYLKLSNAALGLVEKLGILRNETDEEEFEALLRDPFLVSEDKAPYHLSKILFNHVYANYYLAKSDIKNTYKHIHRELELIESHPEKIKVNPKDYVMMLQNEMYLANEMELYNDVYAAIKKLKSLKEEFGEKINRPLQSVIFARTANIELAILIKNRKFDGAFSLIKETESSLNEFKSEVDDAERLTIIYKIAYLYFILGEYDKAIKWTEKILNDPQRRAREDVLSFAFILNLVVHLELGNNELLEYTIRTTYNFLKKQKKLYKVEILFMKLLKELLNYTGFSDIKEACSEFKMKLLRIASDPLEKAAFIYFDFESWAESKITGKKLKDLLINNL